MSIQQHRAVVDLSYPANESTAKEMEAAVLAQVPEGRRLSGLLDAKHIGANFGADFKPVYQMDIGFETAPVEPLLWEGDNT